MQGAGEADEIPSFVEWQVAIPDTAETMPQITAKLFQRPLDNILSAMASLIQQPYGCFEQTSSTTYPMLMALYMLEEMEGQVTDPEIKEDIQRMIEEIKELLEEGYNKLIGFETIEHGYEWFGDAPGHEALTAYGLAQFFDMAAIVDFVDQATIARNTQWLLGRRTGSGTFDLNERALDTFGYASEDITAAYITWVLSYQEEFSAADLQAELNHLEDVSQTTDDPYFLALYAGSLYNVGWIDDAQAIAERFTDNQNPETGAVEGAASSITSSSGTNLLIETTSLALINWLNIDPGFFSE